ncbi:MAG: GlsB/YeaQ/YmgE family stress response membrane protein [Gammaproteobacteria bacterium]|nr:GlsB/YeaQ/YmgE family stress response membrane protein [Gammaproteobacteria bacterium]
MGILSWILFGLIAGALARFLLPGRDPGGFIVTILLGIGGSVIGGLIGTQLGFGKVTGFDLRSMAIAVLGTLILLYGYRLFKNR